MLQSKEELEVLSDESTDVFKQNIIGNYMDQSKTESFYLKKKCLSSTI